MMILDHLNQSQVHPLFSVGGKSLQNPEFQILRKYRKRHYYDNFYTKEDSGNPNKVKYES